MDNAYGELESLHRLNCPRPGPTLRPSDASYPGRASVLSFGEISKDLSELGLHAYLSLLPNEISENLQLIRTGKILFLGGTIAFVVHTQDSIFSDIMISFDALY